MFETHRKGYPLHHRSHYQEVRGKFWSPLQTVSQIGMETIRTIVLLTFYRVKSQKFSDWRDGDIRITLGSKGTSLK
jgi:hypothetical protein